LEANPIELRLRPARMGPKMIIFRPPSLSERYPKMGWGMEAEALITIARIPTRVKDKWNLSIKRGKRGGRRPG
jgi:hypothetical protein